MFSYKVNNGFGRFKVEFPEQWERFHSCNAAIWYGQPAWWNKCNSNGRKLGQTTYVLVSYATPIAIATVYTDYDFHTKNWHIHVNEDAWNCSPTTIRQLSRFLNDIKAPCYQIIKACMHHMEQTNRTSWYVANTRLTIWSETSHAMGLIIHGDLNIPTYYVHSI